MEKSMEEWLKFAIQLERRGVDFYTKCRSATGNQRAMELFDYLVRAENYHEKVLRNVYAAYIKHDTENLNKEVEEFSKTAQKRLFDKNSLNNLQDPDSTIFEAFNTAMAFEDEGMKLYIDLAKKAEDPDLKKLFQKLSAEEVQHKLDIREMGQLVFGIDLVE